MRRTRSIARPPRLWLGWSLIVIRPSVEDPSAARRRNRPDEAGGGDTRRRKSHFERDGRFRRDCDIVHPAVGLLDRRGRRSRDETRCHGRAVSAMIAMSCSPNRRRPLDAGRLAGLRVPRDALFHQQDQESFVVVQDISRAVPALGEHRPMAGPEARLGNQSIAQLADDRTRRRVPGPGREVFPGLGVVQVDHQVDRPARVERATRSPA